MTKKEIKTLEEIIRRFSKNNWGINVLSQHGYEMATDSVRFAVHPADYYTIAKAILTN